MKYKSTRGGVSGLSFEDVLLMGLAPDGGLIIPEKIPTINTKELKHLSEVPYSRLAYEIITRFQEGIPQNDLAQLCYRAYGQYDGRNLIPIKKVAGLQVAELFHGPTCSFKDLPMMFLGQIFEYVLRKRNKKLNIVAATSGDTGGAAIHGMCGRDNINIFVLYPANRVSHVQELQMIATEEKNVFPLEIMGSFDTCQQIVKETFEDQEFKEAYSLGAVNSINWARVVAQIAYYYYVYVHSVHIIGDPIDIVVPTGNFGNIFAGYVAKKMGLPIGKLMIASNRNNILTRTVKFGDYSVEKVTPTLAPAMDIQVASNFERYIYYLFNGDYNKVIEAMRNLATDKEIEFRGGTLGQIQRDFVASDADDANIKNTIREVFSKSNYIIDPHTACGYHAAQKMDLVKDSTVLLATAHPAKFSDVIYDVLSMQTETPPSIIALEDRQTNYDRIDNSPEDLKEYIKSHTTL